jgi:hypothetical protein
VVFLERGVLVFPSFPWETWGVALFVGVAGCFLRVRAFLAEAVALAGEDADSDSTAAPLRLGEAFGSSTTGVAVLRWRLVVGVTGRLERGWARFLPEPEAEGGIEAEATMTSPISWASPPMSSSVRGSGDVFLRFLGSDMVSGSARR